MEEGRLVFQGASSSNQVTYHRIRSAKVHSEERDIWKIDSLEYTHLYRQMRTKKKPENGIMLCPSLSPPIPNLIMSLFFFWLKSFYDFPYLSEKKVETLR